MIETNVDPETAVPDEQEEMVSEAKQDQTTDTEEVAAEGPDENDDEEAEGGSAESEGESAAESA